MKTIFFALLLTTASAQAEHYPILESYDAKAEMLLQASRTARGVEDMIAVREDIRALVADGVEVMKLYASKNPNCQAQFDVFISEVPQMESMSVADLHARYHNGTGLPAAPRHCYFGRSQVVHPMMNLVRIANWNHDTRQELQDDFEEVIEHSARIQKNLDNPPN